MAASNEARVKSPTVSASVRACLSCFASSSRERFSDALMPSCAMPRVVSISSASARSKSSPPSAVSPAVDFTSKMPSDSLRMEISKVPPPRS